MTIARKVVLIVATVLVVSGAALSFGAFAAAGFDFANLSNTRRDWVPEHVTLPAEAEAAHTAIVVHENSQDVRFEPTDGDAIEVEYWTNADRQVNVTDEDGTLSIAETKWSDFRIMLFYLGDYEDRSTVIKVPRSFTGSISVETANSSIDVSQLEGLEGVELSSQNGHVNAARVEADALKLYTQNGSLEARGTTTARLAAETKSGHATLIDVVADEVEALSENGSVNLTRVSAQRVNADSVNGHVEATALSADDIKLTTTNGGVEAVIEGTPDDYAISATSVNGWVEAPHGSSAADAPKRLTARTQNGSIDVSFTEGEGSERRRDSGGLSAPEAPAAPAAPASPDAV